MENHDYSLEPFFEEYPEYKKFLNEQGSLIGDTYIPLERLQEVYFRFKEYSGIDRYIMPAAKKFSDNLIDEICDFFEEDIEQSFYAQIEDNMEGKSEMECRNYFAELKSEFPRGPLTERDEKFLAENFNFYNELEINDFYGPLLKSLLPQFYNYIRKQLKKYKYSVIVEDSSNKEQLKANTAGQKVMLLHHLGIVEFLNVKYKLENMKRIGEILEPITGENRDTIRKCISAIYNSKPDKNDPYRSEKNKIWFNNMLSSLGLPPQKNTK